MNVQESNEREIRCREGSFDMADEKHNAQDDERKQELASMARGLRRMKRHLLLKHVEDDQKPVGSLRDLLLKAAYSEGLQTPPASPRSHMLRPRGSPSNGM